jgi:serine/threonine protein kinase
LAVGRLSTLYRGEHVRTHEVVAVKVLSEYGCRVADKLTRRLGKQWEGERAQKLNHPNVVRTLACGREHGRYYIVMEYLAGGNLTSLLQMRSPAVEGRKIEIMRQAAKGLEYVHSRGVIHRDISPQNIMLAADGTAKLIDFGVSISKADRVLKRGLRTGRPGFMAPELIRDYKYGEGTDIYAFGVSLYHVATGQAPFRTSDDPFEALNIVLNTPIPPLSSLRRTISKRFEAIILRAMEPKPQARYQSVARLLDDLAGVTDADL